MYSSGSVCSWPARYAGISSSTMAAPSSSIADSSAGARDEPLDRELGGDAAYFTPLPGRVDASPFWTSLSRTS